MGRLYPGRDGNMPIFGKKRRMMLKKKMNGIMIKAKQTAKGKTLSQPRRTGRKGPRRP